MKHFHSLRLIFAILFITISCVTNWSNNVPKRLIVTNSNRTIPKIVSNNYFSFAQMPFIQEIIPQTSLFSFVEPDIVQWPVGAIQNIGTVDCEAAGSFTVDVEVFKAGVTDADPMAPGTNINCVVHLGRVAAFGATPCDASPPFNCIRNYAMTYAGMDNGTFDVFTAVIDDLPPGIYEYTCACADDAVIVDPIPHPAAAIMWIGDQPCPATNPFVNGRVTIGDPAPNDDCNGTLEEVFTGPNVVDNLCSVDGLVGFYYEVQIGDIVNFTLTPGTVGSPVAPTYRLNNPCVGLVVSPPFTCLTPGTIIYMQAGNDNACPQYGGFTITVTDMDNGIVNDVCVSATQSNNFGGNNELACGESGSFNGNVNACPDVEATCFGAMTDGIWYSFTTDDRVPTFSISGPGQYELFEGADCASMTSLGCAITNLPNNPTTTYFLLVAPVGSVTVTADFSAPSNDDCTGSLLLTGAGLLNEDNFCADDEVITGCGSNDDNVVWYNFTMPANHENATITVVSAGASPITDPAIGVYSGPCAGLTLINSSCTGTISLTCLVPGQTYQVAVGSATGDAGTFNLTLATSDNGVANDACANATPILNTLTCAYFSESTNTTDACPEAFSLACLGGNYNADATVWMSFVPPVGVTSINLRNITPANAYMSIFTTCMPVATIPGGGCLNGIPPSADINVTAGTTYYIAMAIAGGEGAVDFELRYNERPVNDACASALSNLAGTHTNLCATEDILNPNCPAIQDNASVWFQYTFPAVTTMDAFMVNVTPTGAPAINNALVAVYSACNSGSILMDSDGNDCNATATIECPTPGAIYYIMVSSEFGDEGDFTIAVTTSDNGVVNETCNEATVLMLDNGLCETPPNEFPGETNVDACPEAASLNFGGCTFDDGPGVWYQFTTDANTDLLDIEVTGLNTDIGLFSNCAGASVAGGCGSAGMINDVAVSGNTTYYLLVVGDNGAEGNFTIRITEKSNPPLNDLCSNATMVALGVNTNLNNNCATEDYIPCAISTQNEASVWYYYDYTGPGNEIIFTVTGTGGNGIMTPSVVVYNMCSPGSDETDADGIDCDDSFTLDCPIPNTRYFVFVSSTSNNAGDFSLEVEVNNTAPPNDYCIDAEIIPNNPTCEFFDVVTTTTTDACPEVFSVGGCALDYMQDAVVWYEFTTPPGTNTIEIEAISASAFLSILTACPLGNPASILPGGGCLSGNGTNGTPLNVTENTTYYIAIGIPNGSGSVDFDIKYNLELDNDDPCGGPFIGTVLSDNSTLTNQDNTCATDDDDMCGATDIDNTLWYQFTVSAPNNNVTISVTGTGGNPITDPSIAIFNNIGAGTPNVPCSNNSLNEDCDGDGMATFNCLNPGIYLIQIGSTSGDAGTFSINVTQGQNTAVANDQCTDAEVINITELCVPLDFSTTNIDACPENLPPGSFNLPCDFNSEETSWYTFTAPGMAGDMPTMDFTFTSYSGSGTPFMGIFESSANCANLTPVSTMCRNGLNTTFGNIGPFIPGNQYLIAISSFGDTGGDFDFTVKFNLGPNNDDPCSPNITPDFTLPDGVPTPGTTLCAGGDPFFPDCPQVNQQNVVFFEVTIPDGVRGINISVRARNDNGTPIPGGSPVVVGILDDACGGTSYEEAACLTIGENNDFLCLEPGTYHVQVSTSSANEGDFIITGMLLPYTTACLMSQDNDDCIDALEITSGGVYCEPILINGCNEQACPETFSFGAACPFNTMPVVWYKFTADADVGTIDITGLTSASGNLFMAVFEDNGCMSPPTAISPCITANTNSIAVNEGSTYYIAVGVNSATMTGSSSFRFQIQFNRLPENDDPDPSSPRPPYDLSGFGSHTGNTCCAIGFADDPTLDLANVSCGAATHDNAVWYRYTVGAEQGLQIRVSPGSISGNTTVEVLLGSAAAPGGLYNPTSFHCSSLPAIIKFGCLEPGTELWIKVASRNQDCGDFNIMVTEPDICEYADECGDITAAQTLATAPTDLDCGDFRLTYIDGCLDLACPEDNPTDCGIGDNPTVWFQINTDMNAVQLFTFVTTPGSWQPVWAIYSGTCGDLTLIPGGTITMPTPCSNGDSNPDAHNVGIPDDANGDPITTFYIAISGVGNIDNPNFTLSAFTQAGCVSCIGNDACDPEATFEVTDRSSTRPLDDMTFCQGEDVRVCIEFYYDPSETGVDWFHGLIPNFGRGWDMTAFDPSSVTVSPGGAVWLGPGDGACAPYITEQMPLLCAYTDPDGIIRLCNIKCGACPCSPPLAQGTPLPHGWFWNTNGGAGCQNTCNPATRYGVPGSNSGLTVNICMDLKTKVFDNTTECNDNKSLRISFVTTSDGVSGCWNDPIAECKLDVAQVGPPWEIDCTPPVLVNFDDVELCDNGTLNSQFSTADGSATPINIEPIPNPNVAGMNPYTFPNGSGTVTDMLDNLTSVVQLAQYIVWAQDPTQLCPGPRDTFTVTLYPSLLVVFDPLYVCDGECIDVIPQVVGGTGNYVMYNWSTGEITPTINVCPVTTTTYFVTITDDLGCSGVGSIQVEKKLPVSFDIDPDFVEICQDGVDDNVVLDVTNVIANGFYGVTWTVPSGIDGFPVGNGFTIFDESSTPSEDPYVLCATLTDQFGCEGETCIEVKVNPTPFVELIPNPAPACGATTIDLLVDYIPLDLNNPAAWFYLYSCDDVLIDQIYSNTGPDFTNITLPVGATEYCFRIVVVDDQSGCQNSDELIIPAVIGVPATVSPNTSICAGNFTTMMVTNAASFSTFLWTPGMSGGANYTVSPATTTQYTVVATDMNGCTSQRAIVITVNPLPVVSISGSLSFCPGGNTTLTSSNGASWLWSTPSNPSVATTRILSAITTPDLYTVVVTDANGCTGSATVNVIEDANLSVIVPNLALCDNNADSLDAGPGFLTYLWSNLAGDSLGNEQKLEVTLPGTYVVSVSDGICSGIDSVMVTNSVTPQLTLDTATVCRINSGLGPITLDFTALQNGVSGQWFNTDLAPVDVTDWSNVNFTTVGSRDTFTFTFISDNATAPCNNISIPLEVIVRNCACPIVAVNAPPALCNSTTGTNNTNLNNLRLHSNAGIWTVISGPAPPPTIMAGILNASGAAPGVHRLRFTLNPLPGGNCPDSAEVNITINPAPIVTLTDTTLCNATGGVRPTSVNLNGLLSANSAMGGTWTQTSGTPVGGTIPNISVLGMGVEILQFSYTTISAVAPCAQVTRTVQVTIRDCECPDVVLGRDTLCNGSMTLLDLELPNRFMVDPVTTTGTWTINNPATITNGHFLNPFGLTANNYTATFSITGSLPANCQRTFDKTIVIRNQTIVQTTGSPCSENTGQGPTTVNLFSLLRTGFTSGGVWTQVSPAAPLLTIPANGIVDFVGLTPGDQFVFKYTVNSSLPCTPVDVIVNIRDCNCPPIIINPAPKLCNNGGVTNGMIDLASLLDSQSGAGVWTVLFQGNPVTLAGSVLDVNGKAAGNYRCTYTLVPAPGGTCEKFKEIVIVVENFVTATIMNGEACNTAVSGNSTVLDLITLVVGTPPLTGQWLNPDRTPIVGLPNIDFAGVTPGIYTYYFSINNADPCTDVEIPVDIEVKDCSCPPFTLITPANLCNNTGTLDLATLVTAVPTPGTWSVTNSGGQTIPIVGNILTIQDLPAGDYRLTYTVTNPDAGCPPSKFVTLNVFAPKNAGVGSTASFCAGVTDLVTLNSLLSGQDPGGVWSSTQIAGFNAVAGTFGLTGILPGLYTFTYTFNNQAPCPNTSSEVFVRVNDLPVADAGLDKNIDCVVRSVSLGGNSTTGANIVYVWTFNSAVIGSTQTINATNGGIYTLEVTNTTTGCKSTDMVRVVKADDLPTFDVDSMNVRCFNEKNGFLQVVNLSGGVPPYQYSFDGGATFGSVNRLNNLGPGTYNVQVKESNGCVNEVIVVLTQPDPLSVELGDDVRINLGDSVKIEILSTITSRITRIEWTANGQKIFEGLNLTSFIAKPDVETFYTVTIFDDNGCFATADIKVSIIKVRVLEIPNIIYSQSTNGNQLFIVQSPDLERILLFKIYDRWGNLVYAAENFDPATELDKFWNGTFSGKPVEQGVYVYVIDVLFKDGDFETRAGDVTVIRDRN
ncbi:MAG: gliding motility-associated C-terminal domain-containing protein [Saprospiraceae bacterium]